MKVESTAEMYENIKVDETINNKLRSTVRNWVIRQQNSFNRQQ